ncbi:carbohydrate-binding protein [Paenibacillus gorillae]|uniref:carbohydrate-binding protein n=1 Tax=Paenibacillus gorillae TaxID=1243662 RepID=UPI0004B6E5CF|nr:carbohydrate-binding protein [Paenibacillus gorillae]
MTASFFHQGLAHPIKRLSLALLLIVFTVTGSLASYAGQVQASSGTTYYVAADGNDSNPGTLSQPFATLTGAQSAIRALKTASGLPAGGVTVYLRGGEYNQSATFTLTPEDSGSAGSPIVYQSYPGETAVITGKQEITGWSLLGSPYPAGLPASARGHVFVADISPGWRFHSMFVNKVSQPVAKTVQSPDWTAWPRLTAAGSPSPSGRSITFPSGVLNHVPGNRDAEIAMTTAWWWNIVAPIDSVNPANNTAKLQSKAPVQYADMLSLDGGYYNLRNALPVLDQAGEWVVDSAAGKVYYWPTDGTMSGKTVFASKLNEIVRLQGDEEAQNWAHQVEYVEFRNLHFMYSDRTPEDQYNPDWLVRNAENPDAMIYMQGVSHIVMDSNLIAYSGSQGIALDHYAQNVTLTGNEIAYSSSGGIQITGYGPGDVDVNKNHIIERNHIHDMGLDYMHSGPLSIYGSNHNTVRYNYFHDSPYASVSIVGMPHFQMNNPSVIDTTDSYGNNQAIYQARWTEVAVHRPYDEFSNIPYLHSGDNLIQYNILDNYMESMHDGGALYTWAAGADNLWDQNVGTSPLNKGVSLYFDLATAYLTATNNIFWSPGDLLLDISGNSTNTSINNSISATNKPAGYDLLRNTIINAGNAAGGWLGANLTPVVIPTSATSIIQAEGHSAEQGTQTDSGGTGSYVGSLDSGDWLRYDNIDFGTGNALNGFHVSAAVDPANAGKQLELRLDSITGTLIGTITISNTGGWNTFTTQTASISGASGVHDLFLVPKDSGVANVDWFTFSTTANSTIQAEYYSTSQGVQAGNGGTGAYLGWIDEGDWISYNNIDFGNGELNQFQASAAVDPGYAGKQIELRLDSKTGPLIGTFTFSDTGGWTSFQTQTTDVSGASGVHHLFLVAKGSGIGFGSIDWFTFKKATRYEAENAALNGVVIENLGSASNGHNIGYFDNIGDYVNVTPVISGSILSIRYSNGNSSAKQASLYVNGSKTQTVVFPATASWTNYRTLTVNVPVSGSVKFQIDSADKTVNGSHSCCNIDYIEIS